MMTNTSLTPPTLQLSIRHKLPVPETIHLADHSITRTARQGLLAYIEVSGKPVPGIFESETA